jgi:hypothetical protein
MKPRPTRRAPPLWMVERPPDNLYELLDSALQKRELFFPERKLRVNGEDGEPLGVKREILLRMIVTEIEEWQERAKWKEAHPEQHTEKIENHKQIVVVVDKLMSQIEAAQARLIELGALQLVVIDPVAEFKGNSAGRVPYSICRQALTSLRRWDYFNPHKKGPRPALSAVLTFELQFLCRRLAGCTAVEFDELLERLNSSELWSKSGLPKLSVATLKQRKHRAKKKAETK